MAHPLASIWEEQQTEFLSDSGDIVTINYKPVRSESDPTFDGFFQEGTDPSDPTSFSNIVETAPDPEGVTGKVHLDLHGASISPGEGEQQLPVGRFAESDAWFVCLLSDVKISTDPDPIKTKFHNAWYVMVDKDGEKYEVKAIKSRGMGAAFVVDVFLKKTNK